MGNVAYTQCEHKCSSTEFNRIESEIERERVTESRQYAKKRKSEVLSKLQLSNEFSN